MDKSESLNHTKWDCKYQIVFIPKNRKKVHYGKLRVHLGAVFRKLAQHKESRIEEGHLIVGEGQPYLVLAGMTGHAAHRVGPFGSARDGFQPGLRMSQPPVPTLVHAQDARGHTVAAQCAQQQLTADLHSPNGCLPESCPNPRQVKVCSRWRWFN
jgi:hypothetical protein